MLALFTYSLLGTTLPNGLQSRYDVVVVGTGLKESLMAGLLARHGKSVLQVESSSESGGGLDSLDLQQLAELTDGGDAPLSPKAVGDTSAYSIDRAPKLFLASGSQLQVLIASGAWHHMNPPGFKRVHRSLIYRRRPDGKPDVHRILANSEDVVKTRMLTPLEKARVVQFYLWVERYDEDDERTHAVRPLSSKTLNLRKMSAAKFLAYWELPKAALSMVVRGIALHEGGPKSLKRMPATEMVQRIQRYTLGYKTFPHMTCPYVYPVGGFGAGLARGMAAVLDEEGGASLAGSGTTADEVLVDASGAACGVRFGDATIDADCVVCPSAYAPDGGQPADYDIVRLYAVLAHPPNMCKDATSCQLILPAAHTSRNSDVYLAAYGPTHAVAPKGRWLVVASARVEGAGDAESAMAVAKRELASVLPLLKPSKKLFASVTPYHGPQSDGAHPNVHVLGDLDETSYFDSVEDDLASAFERITGESIGSSR